MRTETLLEGAYDLHVHASPDMTPRAMDAVELGRAANAAGMAGLVLKDHTAPTTGRAFVLNRMLGGPCRFYGTVVLNPTVGYLNPAAVRAALVAGARMVFLPTYGAAHHIRLFGAGKPPLAYPFPEQAPTGLDLADGAQGGRLDAVLREIAEADAVFCTGHVSPAEGLDAIGRARAAGVKRMLVTHASIPRLGYSPDEQKQAAGQGALIEHAFIACTDIMHEALPIELLRDQIRHVGPEHCVLSSDFGQVANGSPVENFALHLERLHQAGMSQDDLRTMVHDNPHRLMEGT